MMRITRQNNEVKLYTKNDKGHWEDKLPQLIGDFDITIHIPKEILKSNKYKIVKGNVTIQPLGESFSNTGAVNLVVEEGEGCNITIEEIDDVIKALTEAKKKAYGVFY